MLCLPQSRGVSALTEEDFFASSPSANLVGVNEEGHWTTRERGCEHCASQPLFVSTVPS